MTVLLVLFTLLLFLAADYFVQRFRTARQVQLAGTRVRVGADGNALLPEDASLVSNHTWTRPGPGGNIIIGVDELLARALGAVEQVLLPEAGSVVTPATADIGLAANGCTLDIASPVHGRVVEVNQALLRNPALAKDDPYGAGWLMKIRPASRHSRGISPYVVRRPAEWLRAQQELMREFFLQAAAQTVPVLMQDGGEPVEGILQEFDAGVWGTFRTAFATLRDPEPAADTRQEHRP
jgi:glycine cleavage system H protein